MSSSNNEIFSISAKRGFVYRFTDDHAKWTDKYVLVVSSDSRRTDKLVSILVLGDSSAGEDVVPVKVPNVGTMYAHCGMITYIGRQLLSEEICQVAKATMTQINHMMLKQYGLVDEATLVKYNHYQTQYENLLDKLIIKGDVY